MTYFTSQNMIRTGFALASLFLVLPLQASAPGAETGKTLFKTSELLKITLKGPLGDIKRDKSKTRTHEGSLTYVKEAGQQKTIGVKIQLRGNSRREVVCDFPPLKIRFDKSNVKGTAFEGQKSLKLVTYCSTQDRFQQYNIKEFLAYRIFNLITPYSFRVRPLLVKYVEGNDSSGTERFGFFIEDIDDVAKRNSLKDLNLPAMVPGFLSPEQTAISSLFQYFISNLDWSPLRGPKGEPCCHNIKLIGKKVGAKSFSGSVYPIPYDFDMSGFVNPHYWTSPGDLKVSRASERLYRGQCLFNDSIPAALERFKSQHKEIVNLIETQELLDAGNRENTINFVSSFYDRLSSPEAIKENLLDKCRP